MSEEQQVSAVTFLIDFDCHLTLPKTPWQMTPCGEVWVRLSTATRGPSPWGVGQFPSLEPATPLL